MYYTNKSIHCGIQPRFICIKTCTNIQKLWWPNSQRNWLQVNWSIPHRRRDTFWEPALVLFSWCDVFFRKNKTLEGSEMVHTIFQIRNQVNSRLKLTSVSDRTQDQSSRWDAFSEHSPSSRVSHCDVISFSQGEACAKNWITRTPNLNPSYFHCWNWFGITRDHRHPSFQVF